MNIYQLLKNICNPLYPKNPEMPQILPEEMYVDLSKGMRNHTHPTNRTCSRSRSSQKSQCNGADLRYYSMLIEEGMKKDRQTREMIVLLIADLYSRC